MLKLNFKLFNSAILFCLIALLIISCNSNVIFDKTKKIEKGVWNQNNRLNFEIPINDTITAFDIYINVRNSSDYAFSNLYLFMFTSFPDRSIAQDTLELILADDRGQWLGNGLGDIKDNQIALRKNIRFPQKGLYSFAFNQAMRRENLNGIIDIGLKIEKHSSENIN